jgi:hypothetical protein
VLTAAGRPAALEKNGTASACVFFQSMIFFGRYCQQLDTPAVGKKVRQKRIFFWKVRR